MTENPTRYAKLANAGARAQSLGKRSLNEVSITIFFRFEALR